MKQEMDAAEQALSAITDKSQEAQLLDVTHGVMKNLTDMVDHQSELESGSYEQLMQLRQQSATANLIGANISEALDEGNRAKPWVGDGGGAAGSAGGGECLLARGSIDVLAD